MARARSLVLTLCSWWFGAVFAELAWGLASEPGRAGNPRTLSAVCAALAVAAFAAPVVARASSRLRRLHDGAVSAVTSSLDRLAHRPLLWNAVFAGLALFVEMAVIRWTSALLPSLAHLRNFALLACFLGLGLGALTGRTRPALVPYLLPLLALHYLQATLLGLQANLLSTPAVSPIPQFVLVVLVTMPAGQLVGRLLARRSDLGGYGANLLGSLLGAGAALALAALWTGPAAWLAVVGSVYLLAFREWRGALVGAAGVLAAVGLGAVVPPAGVFELWSPYHRLLLAPRGFGHELGDGRVGIYANGRYYQSFPTVDTRRVRPELDVQERIPNADLGPVRGRLSGKRVLALGTGAGSNLPAFLRAGVDSIVAVDIDPAIVLLGRALNAERPYDDARVSVVIDDARAFLRRTTERFDLIVFLWIDSHPGGTGTSGFRLDSFVYTRECFELAAARLAPGGQVLLYTWMSHAAAKKILRVFGSAFAGHPIAAFSVKPYAEQWLFTAGDVDPSGGSRFVAPTSLSPDTDATDGTPITDDWPFLYLGEGPGTPANLLGFLALVAVASVGAVLLVMPRAEVPATRAGLAMAAVFFLFGAAFMLVETVSIMQVALLFGNTWHVVSTVILAVLLMAFCGNAIVERRLLPDVRAGWFAGLLLALLGCWLLRPDDVVRGLGVSLGPVVYVGLAASPVLFSSVLFSLAVRGEGELDRALGFNLLGAMAGGCLEYASLITGYRALTLGTMALYALAALAWWSASRSRAG